MTKRQTRRIFASDLIESVTGWTGAQGDKSPSAVSATKPSAEHITGKFARCFDVSNGGPMPKISHKSQISSRMSSPLEFKFATDDATGLVRGYASTFGGNPDAYGDVIAKGAYSRTLREHRAQGSMPAMLWSHDPARPIGKWLDMHEDEYGLSVLGTLNLDTSGGKDAHAHLKNGDVSGISIGYAVGPSGSKTSGSTRLLTDIDLIEVSIVTFPANSRSRVSGVKSLQSKSDLIEMLREGGLPKAAAARIAAGGWSAVSGEDHSEKAIALADVLRGASAQLRK